MNENGKWLPKAKTTYDLDENNNRINGENGKWKRIHMDTIDWNGQKYCEVLRHKWKV